MIDDIVIDIIGRVSADLDAVNPAVNEAYRVALERIGATSLFDQTVNARAQASTFELILNTARGGAAPSLDDSGDAEGNE